MPSHQRGAIAMRLNADEFSQQMIDSAAGREQRTSESNEVERGAAGAPPIPQFKTKPAAWRLLIGGYNKSRCGETQELLEAA